MHVQREKEKRHAGVLCLMKAIDALLGVLVMPELCGDKQRLSLVCCVGCLCQIHPFAQSGVQSSGSDSSDCAVYSCSPVMVSEFMEVPLC